MVERRNKSKLSKPSARFAATQRPAGRSGSRPIVAIVGRPNVGKSALFNRLSGSRLSIVEDIPGVTRDRIYADCLAFGRPYVLIDTGGFDPDSDDPMTQGIVTQVKIALSEADLVLCVFDGSADPTPADRKAIELLRKSEIPVLYAANKIDNPRRSLEANDLYRLGIDQLFPISALHGHGIGDLEEAMLPHLFEAEEQEAAFPELTRIAIIGRPNAGKSSLVNRLLGEERQLVDDRPGTTVDSVDALVEFEGQPFILIDTAGIRRKRSIEKGIEALSVVQAVRAIERSDVVVLMIDAKRGASEQDTKIAGLALDRGRAVVLALNKMDLVAGDERKQAESKLRDVLSFMSWAPSCRVSVKTGRGVRGLLQKVQDVAVAHKKRVTTGELNRFFEEVLERHPPPTQGGRAVRVYFVTQASVAPPTFVLISNYPDRVHFSYRRYVSNQLRDRFGFEGTPIRVFYREKKKNKG